MTRLAFALASLLAAPLAVAEGPVDTGADAYTVEVSSPQKPVKVGEKVAVKLSIHPKAPWHVDPRAPLTIKLEAPAGLAAEKAQLSRKDAVDAKAEVPRFELPFTATASGQQEAKAHLKFFLCRDTICAQQQRTVSATVAVK